MIRIIKDPARMTGEPTIGESRLTVRTMLGLIAHGYSDAQILASYDYLTQEGLDAARAWWASPEGMAWALGRLVELDEVRFNATPGPNRVRDAAVIAEIMAERERAYAKWGPQPYPWTCYEDEDINGLHDIAERLERVARDAMAERAAKGLPPTRAQIVAEEAGEALREIDPKRARKELIQLGAMVVAALSECPDLWEEE